VIFIEFTKIGAHRGARVKGTNRGIDVVKVRIFVNDKVFGSSESSKATTLLIQDGRVKIHHGATCGVQQNHW